MVCKVASYCVGDDAILHCQHFYDASAVGGLRRRPAYTERSCVFIIMIAQFENDFRAQGKGAFFGCGLTAVAICMG